MRRVRITDALRQEGGNDPHFQAFPLQVHEKRLDGPVSPHLHDAFEIEWVKSGHGVNVCDGVDFPVGPGDGFLGNHLESHAIRYRRAPVFVSLKFRPSLVLAAGDAASRLLDPFVSRVPGFRGNMPLSPEERALAGSLLMALAAERRNREGAWQDLSRALFLSLLELIHRAWVRHAGKRAPPPHAALPYRVMAFLEEHFDEDLKVDELARRFELSPSRLGALFREVFGQGIKPYLTTLRLTHAKELLSRGVGVTEAAVASGFNEVSVFHKAFKKATGLAPSRYADG